MKTNRYSVLLALLLSAPIPSKGQQASDLTVMTATGRTLTFQTAEQKTKYLATVERARQSNANATAQAEAQRKKDDEARFESYQMKKWAEANKVVVQATVGIFEDGGMMAHIRRYEPYEAVHEEGLNQVHTIEWSALHIDDAPSEFVFIDHVPAGAVNDSVYRLEVYPCGIRATTSSRYSSFTTDVAKAYKYALEHQSAGG